MISVVIVTLNEGDKLEKCLANTNDFAQELVVVDLDSKDNTLEVAKKFGAKVYEHERAPFVEEVRNFAISKTSGDWILVLDPDEILSEGLKSKLRIVAKEDKYQAVNIPRKNIFFGKWIAHTNFWPDKHIRFFKKGSVDWPKIIHTYPKIKGQIYNLPADEKVAIEHFGYDNFGQFIGRQHRYASVQAQNNLEEGKHFSLLRLFWMPAREFLVRFIKHRGFLDGVEGLFLVVALMWYQIEVEIKVLKLERKR